MTFQALDLKGNHFLDLLDDKLYTIELLYIKRSLWIKQFSYSNSLCIRATRAIMNHTSIEYCLRFFLRKDFSYLCGIYLIEIRHYILYECRRYNKYWNPLRSILSYLLAFLNCNPSVFSFYEVIT